MKCVTPNGRPLRATWITAGTIALILVAVLPLLRLDTEKLGSATGRLGAFVAKMASPQDVSYWPKLSGLLAESLGIAFVSVVFAIVPSIILGFMAARNATPAPWLAGGIKGVSAIGRAVPDLVLALLLSSSIGLGPPAAIAALTISATVFLIKAFAEAIETVDPKPAEGVVAAGADWLGTRTIGLFPAAAPDLIGLSLYQYDALIRSAAILGAVGAGGIGYDLSQAIRLQQFDRLASILIAIYLVVSLIDIFSARVRRKLT